MSATQPPPALENAAWRAWLPDVAAFLSVLVVSALIAPIPGVNEPHYLCKAKHYWNPAWCAGDFFLESSNTHLVFYWTIGALTQFVSLAKVAWLGRIGALALLSAGWMRLGRRLLGDAWAAVWALWVFLAWTVCLNLSGEWVVGGFQSGGGLEAKVFAYAFCFLGLSFAFERRWNGMGLWLGLAVGMHPIVGIWSAAALAFAILLSHKPLNRSADAPPAAWGKWTKATLVLGLAAAPGLLPALGFLLQADPSNKIKSDYIQVFYRLHHHLYPMSFSLTSAAVYVGVFAGWVFLDRRRRRSADERLFYLFVIGAALIAFAGLCIGWGPKNVSIKMINDNLSGLGSRMPLLKFYWFRLFDMVLPLAVSVGVVGILCRRNAAGSALRRGLPFAVVFAILCVTIANSRFREPPRADHRADWIAACRWIRANTPEDALCIAPTNHTTFKWHAYRAEYVSFKDCPQDGPGILEWNRRLITLHKWGQEHFDDGYTTAALGELRKQTGADYLVTWRLGPMTGEPVHQSGRYRVYQLP